MKTGQPVECKPETVAEAYLALLASRRRRLLWDGSRWSDHHHTNDNNNSGSAGLGGSSLPPPPFILREDEWRHEPDSVPQGGLGSLVRCRDATGQHLYQETSRPLDWSYQAE